MANDNRNVSAERTKSLWMASAEPPKAPRLGQSIDCNVVVIGSGIAGLSCAYELACDGLSVVVLDRAEIGSGMTARTTAHLAPICDDGISALIEVRGEGLATGFQESQEAAVDRIESIVAAENISCNFRRLDGILFPALNMDTQQALERLEQEYDAAQRAKVDAGWMSGVPFSGFEKAKAIRYPNQATFHPLRYLNGLAKGITQRGGQLFANTIVQEIEENDNGVRVTTTDGHVVTAAHAIVATNGPINDRGDISSKLAPYRTYAMAFTIPRGGLPDALYWDLAEPYHYVRLNPGPGTVDYLIVGGADHKSGESDDGDVRFLSVEAWIRQLVPNLGNEVARWSGQVLDTPDYCGFIGLSPGKKHIYVVTGDSGQGMTHGALSGLVIKDLIMRGTSRWEDVYAPDRKPAPGLLNYISENVTALKGLAEHLMPSKTAPGEVASADQIAPGSGAIMNDGNTKLAVYRDDSGELHTRSAACTHLGCVVHWNSTENCWDCPCHGSQFAPDGTVLNGPAISPLAEKEGAKERASSKASP